MEITGLFELLADIIPSSENLKTTLQAIVIEKKYPRKSLLLEEGTINTAFLGKNLRLKL